MSPGSNKRTDRLALVAGLSCLLLLGGCLSGRQAATTLPGVSAAELARALLVLPPFAASPAQQPSAQRLGHELFQEASQRLPGILVDGAHVDALGPFLMQGDLQTSSPLPTAELAAAGKALSCGAVLVIVLHDATLVPPLGVSLRIVWIDSDADAIIWDRRLRLRLSDPQVSARYRCYLEQRETATSEAALDAAFLSPRLFHQFVASCTLDALTNAAHDRRHLITPN